jgi:hypothetical protein
LGVRLTTQLTTSTLEPAVFHAVVWADQQDAKTATADAEPATESLPQGESESGPEEPPVEEADSATDASGRGEDAVKSEAEVRDEQDLQILAGESSDSGEPSSAEPSSQDALPEVAPSAEGIFLEALQEVDEPLEFVTNVRYLTENRPDWLEGPAHLEGDVHWLAVKAGPHVHPQRCAEDLRKELLAATRDYVNEFLQNPQAATLIGVNLPEIEERLVSEKFAEVLDTSVGRMNQLHARLEFDKAFRRHLEERWRQIRATSRLLQTLLGSGAVLLLIGTLFSYFRLDTATKGYYTGRLQFTAAAAILALVAACVLLARWIPWM